MNCLLILYELVMYKSKNKAANDKNKFGVYNQFKATVTTTSAKVKTSYKSGKKMKIVLKYHKNKYITMNIKLKIKVYTGKKYKTYYATTDSNGIAYFKASRFSKGAHKVEITSANSNVKFKKVKTSIIITKSKGKISAPKVSSKYKSNLNSYSKSKNNFVSQGLLSSLSSIPDKKYKNQRNNKIIDLKKKEKSKLVPNPLKKGNIRLKSFL